MKKKTTSDCNITDDQLDELANLVAARLSIEVTKFCATRIIDEIKSAIKYQIDFQAVKYNDSAFSTIVNTVKHFAGEMAEIRRIVEGEMRDLHIKLHPYCKIELSTSNKESIKNDIDDNWYMRP